MLLYIVAASCFSSAAVLGVLNGDSWITVTIFVVTSAVWWKLVDDEKRSYDEHDFKEN